MDHCRKYWSARRKAYTVSMSPLPGGRYQIRIHMDTAETRLIANTYAQADELFRFYRDESEREI